MINEDINSKLTPSAKEAIDVIADEYKQAILERAFSIANERETANKEVSLRDILDAKKPMPGLTTETYKINKLTRRATILTLSGVVYTILGVIIYFIQNKDISFTTDLGPIISIFGFLVSFVTYFYYQLKLKSDSYLRNSKFNPILNYKDYEIVKRWMVIETLAKKSVSNEGKDGLKLNSVSFLIRYMSHKIAKDEIEYLKIRKLLLTRNKIVHEGYSLEDNERKELLHFANELIDRLENIQTQERNNSNTLIVVNAIYGTAEKSADATSVLNQLINNNVLEFVVNNELVGDPDFGKVKHLNISYKLGRDEKVATYKEGDKVVIR